MARQDGERKPRQPYQGEEREQREMALAAAMVGTANQDYPDGMVRTAAREIGLPVSTAFDWVKADDEGFKLARRAAKREFTASGTRILDTMMRVLGDKLTDPDQIAKLPIDKTVWSIGVMYDKIALAAGEHEANPMAMLAAGITIGRAVERGRGEQQAPEQRPATPDADFTVLD